MSSVFLSYSSADRMFALRLASDLKFNSISVWLDEWEVRVGDELRQKIERGISEYQYFLIVLSRASVASRWVQKELNAAFAKEIGDNGTVILPAKIDEVDVPLLISGKKYANFVESYEHGLAEILDAVLPLGERLLRYNGKDALIFLDDFMEAENVLHLLKSIGIEASAATSVSSGLQLAYRYNPSLVITEIWGHWNGYSEFSEFISELRRACPEARIVGLHAYRANAEINALLDAVEDSLYNRDQVMKLLSRLASQKGSKA